MLCLDTSSVIAYLQGEEGADVETVDQALLDQVGVLSPVTVAELLSDPHRTPTLRRTIPELPTPQLPMDFGNVLDFSEQRCSRPVAERISPLPSLLKAVWTTMQCSSPAIATSKHLWQLQDSDWRLPWHSPNLPFFLLCPTSLSHTTSAA